MSSEYALIYMNMSNCAKILNIPESAKIYPNGMWANMCFNISNIVNMAESA